MRRLWIPAFWTSFALVSALQTWLAMLTHGHSFPRIVFYQVCVWAGWMILTPAVIRLALAALTMAVAHVAYRIPLTILIQPYDHMTIREFGPNFPVHRSAIVNLDRVKEMHPLFRGDCALVLADGTQLRLSRARREEFERRLAGT